MNVDLHNDLLLLIERSRRQRVNKRNENTKKNETESEEIEYQIKKILETETPLKEKILNLSLSLETKALVMQKWYLMEKLDPNSTEFFKQKQWIECILDMPWDKYRQLGNNGDPERYIMKIKTSLDSAIYGLKDTKEQILTFCCKLLKNPEAKGHVLALQGNPGVGKTSIIRNLADTLNLPLRMISLGGLKDANYFTGHGFTYEGAIPGRIVQILRETRCMNPIIYLDELDKITDPEHSGVNGILTHLLDTTTNSEFEDQYLHGIPIDLSRVFFAFSFNDINKVDPIVRDRMKVIFVPDPIIDEKVEIAKRHLIPKILDDIGLEKDTIKFTNSSIRSVILKSKVNEKGVRQLYRNLETICLRVNLLMTCPNVLNLLDVSFGKNMVITNGNRTITDKDVDELFDEFTCVETNTMMYS